MDDELKRFWVGFNLIKGIGPTRLRTLLEVFCDIQSAWNAPEAALEQAGLSSRLIKSLVEIRKSSALDRVWDQVQSLGITVLTWDDEQYPRRLKEIDQSPPVIYLRGEINVQDIWSVAVVGTRRVTAYGRQLTNEVASVLARNGITVVSGLARGVDAIAHQAALQAGGRTLAVLGHGLDQVYPPENRSLAEKIITQGALISDYPPGTPPEPNNFPPRNRLISGLSQAVVITEAGDHSGALITAAFAVEQGREVFAIPGQIYAPQSRGTNRLIREGARILIDLSDILEYLNIAQLGEQRSARLILPEDATEAQLYSLLGREPMYIDEIRLKSELPIEKVSAALTLMELKGIVRQVGSMRYVAVYETSPNYEVNKE